MRLDQRAEATAKSICTGLQAIASPIEEIGWGHWRFRVSNGKPVAATARLADDWLVLDVPLANGRDAHRPWTLIAANAGLGSYAKFALDRRDGCPKLLSEIPLIDDRDVAPQLTVAYAGLEQGLELFGGLEETASGTAGEAAEGVADRASDAPPGTDPTVAGRASDTPPEIDPTTEHPDLSEARPDLLDLCEQAGWPGRSRRGGAVVVDLEVAGGFWQAQVVRPTADGGATRASVRLALRDGLSDDAHRALGFFLLAATGVSRWTRASLEDSGTGHGEHGEHGREGEHGPGSPDDGGIGRAVPCFEVCCAGIPTSSELNRAFSALSVACRFFGREARLIQTRAVSSRYMELRHPTHR